MISEFIQTQMRRGLAKSGQRKDQGASVARKEAGQMACRERSFAQILDWSDCLETTHVQTAMGSYRWAAESVARDRLFLEYPGMTS
ncbi:MAG: hypothetical protein A3K90_05580 [Pelodictyon luteolum]|uniref:Uncharacterized protein n=1 Tax=Pelodictyon luteolum TaxID=1100 RepID=A0A165MFM7_PELLU|nr:MAG: hypothetical protein A3K90_05580 [Pelodictyon luteolum]